MKFRSFSSGIVLIVFLSISTLEGINESIIGPIFPHQARLFHNASYFEIGLTLGMFPIGQILISLFLGYVQLKAHFVQVFTFGALISAVTILGFGMTDFLQEANSYLILSCTNRLVNGAGVGCVMCTYFPLAVKAFSNFGSSAVTLFLTCFFLGLSLGPFLSLKLSHMISYKSVYMLSFMCELIFISLFCDMYQLTCLPDRKNEDIRDPDCKKDKCKLFYQLLRSPPIIIVFLAITNLNATIAFVECNLADIMKSEWRSTEYEVELTYLIACIVLVPASLGASFLSVKGFSFQLLAVSSFLYSNALIALYIVFAKEWLPHYPTIIFIMIFLNIPRGTMGTVAFVVVDCYCIEEFKDFDTRSIRALIAPCFAIADTSGPMIGSVLYISLLQEFLGYRLSTLIIICISQLLTHIVLFTFIKNKHIFKKHFTSVN